MPSERPWHTPTSWSARLVRAAAHDLYSTALFNSKLAFLSARHTTDWFTSSSALLCHCAGFASQQAN
jgi:hypothetical protein